MQDHTNDGPNRRGWEMQDQIDFKINVINYVDRTFTVANNCLIIPANIATSSHCFFRGPSFSGPANSAPLELCRSETERWRPSYRLTTWHTSQRLTDSVHSWPTARPFTLQRHFRPRRSRRDGRKTTADNENKQTRLVVELQTTLKVGYVLKFKFVGLSGNRAKTTWKRIRIWVLQRQQPSAHNNYFGKFQRKSRNQVYKLLSVCCSACTCHCLRLSHCVKQRSETNK